LDFSPLLVQPQHSLTADNAGSRRCAISVLIAFIKSVEAQRGKKVSDADANALIDAATAITDMATSDVAAAI
jgi:hypothetical protein